MGEGQKHSPFTVSPAELDFGVLARGSGADKQLILTNHSGRNLAFNFTWDRPWLKLSALPQSGNDIPLKVRVEPSLLSGLGAERGSVSIQAEGHAVRVTVKAAVGIASSAAKSSGSHGRKSASSALLSLRSLPILQTSFYATLAGLFLLFSAAALAAAPVVGRTPDARMMIPAAAGVIVGLYLLVSLSPALPVPGRSLDPSSANPDHKRLFSALESACRRYSMSVPRVVLRQDAKPNLRSFGLSSLWCCLHVNTGLLATFRNEDELQAVFAHELAHINRYDTLFVSCLWPAIKVINGVLAFVRMLLGGFGKATRGAGGSGILPLMLMMRGPRIGMLGCLVTFIILLLVVLMFAVFAMYAFMLLAPIVILGILCLFYLQRTEFLADEAAAEALGDSDKVVAALLRGIDAWPEEVALAQNCASAVVGGSGPFNGNDVVRSIQAAPAGMVPGTLSRLGRSHPYVVERIARLIKRFGTHL